MTAFAHAIEADQRHAFRQSIIAEIADAIRTGTLDEVQAKYPGIPARVIAEAQHVADLAEAEEWWRSLADMRAGE